MSFLRSKFAFFLPIGLLLSTALISGIDYTPKVEIPKVKKLTPPATTVVPYTQEIPELSFKSEPPTLTPIVVTVQVPSPTGETSTPVSGNQPAQEEPVEQPSPDEPPQNEPQQKTLIDTVTSSVDDLIGR